jgi:hypothetical protein
VAEVFETTKHPLNDVAAFVSGFVERMRLLPIGLVRDRRQDALGFQIAPPMIRVDGNLLRCSRQGRRQFGKHVLPDAFLRPTVIADCIPSSMARTPAGNPASGNQIAKHE